jgi:hypothetical protein
MKHCRNQINVKTAELLALDQTRAERGIAPKRGHVIDWGSMGQDGFPDAPAALCEVRAGSEIVCLSG